MGWSAPRSRLLHATLFLALFLAERRAIPTSGECRQAGLVTDRYGLRRQRSVAQRICRSRWKRSQTSGRQWRSGGAAECKPFKDDRAARLEQDLAAARRDVETQTALQSDGTVALLLQEALQFARESLKRERARAARLEQDLAAARHDVETQTVLATKASAEAAQVKQATKGGGSDLQKSLQEEHARADRLEQDLASARRDVETKTALVIKASDAAARAKQAAESGASDQQKSLQQEHARADRLERDLAAARRDVETKTALATKASAEAAQAETGGGSWRRRSAKVPAAGARPCRPIGAGSCSGPPRRRDQDRAGDEGG